MLLVRSVPSPVGDGRALLRATPPGHTPGGGRGSRRRGGGGTGDTDPAADGVTADLTAGTGHFNVAQGAIATAQGIGGALSTSVAGAIVVGYGYGAAFITLGIAAGIALALLLLLMPEPSTRTTAQVTAP